MSTISAGTTSGTALVTSGDTSGTLVLQTNGTTTAVTIATNQVVTLAQPLPVASGGTGSSSGVNLATGVTGTLPVANGGTGATSLTANNVLLGNGTSALQVVAPGTNGNVLTSNGTTWASTALSAGGFTLGTPVTLSSQSSISITGIPSNVKTIEINYSKIGFSSSDCLAVRLGTSGGVDSASYESLSFDGNISSATGSANGWWMYQYYTNPQTSGTMFLHLVDATNNIWVQNYSGVNYGSNNRYICGGGYKALSGVLTQLYLYPPFGNNFATGVINICYGT